MGLKSDNVKWVDVSYYPTISIAVEGIHRMGKQG
jgi:hypothetical protein